MSNDVQKYIIVDDLFSRYTIIVDIFDRTISVHCDECNEWVLELDGEQISRHTHVDFMEMILREHEHQVIGHEVSIHDPSTDLSSLYE
jgi:hypothetical protein